MSRPSLDSRGILPTIYKVFVEYNCNSMVKMTTILMISPKRVHVYDVGIVKRKNRTVKALRLSENQAALEEEI